MWLLTDTGFLSIVQHRSDPTKLLVRARVRGDLQAFAAKYETLFGDALTIQENPNADYRWRTVAARDHVADLFRAKIMELDYDSHVKDVAIRRSGPNAAREAAYYATWNAMYKMQKADIHSDMAQYSRS